MAEKTGVQATGKVKEAVGWLTGDRDVEAEGAAEQLSGDRKPAGAGVDAVKEEIRADHGDIRPEDKAAKD